MIPRIDSLGSPPAPRPEHRPHHHADGQERRVRQGLGLEIGADDYITKDKFSLREFRSRVRAQLRRAEMSRSAEATKKDVIKVDDLEVDVLKRNVIVRGAKVDLTYIEFEISRRSSRTWMRLQPPLLLQLSGRLRLPQRALSTCTSATCARRWEAPYPSTSSRSAISATSSASLRDVARRPRHHVSPAIGQNWRPCSSSASWRSISSRGSTSCRLGSRLERQKLADMRGNADLRQHRLRVHALRRAAMTRDRRLAGAHR
jgi:hypothetical protein